MKTCTNCGHEEDYHVCNWEYCKCKEFKAPENAGDVHSHVEENSARGDDFKQPFNSDTSTSGTNTTDNTGCANVKTKFNGEDVIVNMTTMESSHKKESK